MASSLVILKFEEPDGAKQALQLAASLQSQHALGLRGRP